MLGSVRTGEELLRLPRFSSRVIEIDFDQSGKHILVVEDSGRILRFDTASGAYLTSTPEYGRFLACAFSHTKEEVALATTGAPHEIVIIEVDTGQVVWRENHDLPGERRIVWTKWVTDLLEGEQANAEDDNGNGLEDEAGLAFDMEGRKITIRITLQSVDAEGNTMTRTVEKRVTARN